MESNCKVNSPRGTFFFFFLINWNIHLEINLCKKALVHRTSAYWMLHNTEKKLFNRSSLQNCSSFNSRSAMDIPMLPDTYSFDCVFNFISWCPICSLASLTSVKLRQTQEGYLSFPTVWSKNWIFTVQNMYTSSIRVIPECCCEY